jgi:hypothetical protein
MQVVRSKQLCNIYHIVSATYTQTAKQIAANWQQTQQKLQNLLLVKMKEKKLPKMQSLPKVLRSQAMRSTT